MGGGGVGFGAGVARLIKPPRAESHSGTTQSRFDFFLNNSDMQKKKEKKY